MADAAPAFDPTQPFEAVDSGGVTASAPESSPAPAFDPAQPFEPVASPSVAAPAFDPSQPFEPVESGGALSVFGSEAAAAPIGMVGQAAKSIATTATPSVTPDQSKQFLDGFSSATTDDQRQSLTAKAIMVLPKPLAMDYNAALQRVAAGSDPAAERAKLEAAFPQWTQAGTPGERHGALYRAGEAITDFGKNTVGATPTEQAIHPIASGAGQGVGTVASIALLNPAIGTPAALAAGAALFGLSSQQDTYEDAINHGSDEATARKAASISGGVNAALGIAPVGNVLHPFTKFMPEASGWAMRMLARAGQNSVTFGTVAEAQNYLGQQVAKLYNSEAGYDLPFTTKMATERLMGELLAGAIVGGSHGVFHELGVARNAEPAVVPPEQHADALRNILGDQPGDQFPQGEVVRGDHVRPPPGMSAEDADALGYTSTLGGNTAIDSQIAELTDRLGKLISFNNKFDAMRRAQLPQAEEGESTAQFNARIREHPDFINSQIERRKELQEQNDIADQIHDLQQQKINGQPGAEDQGASILPRQAPDELPPGIVRYANHADVSNIKDMIGRKADPEEIAAHPAVVRANEDMSNRPHTVDMPGFGTPEFEANREFNFNGENVVGYDNAVPKLIDQAKSYANGPVDKGKQAIIITGPPASGKSTIAEQYAKTRRAALVDVDDSKYPLAEYDNGGGTQAVHEESAYISGKVLQKLRNEGSNLILPVVGADPETISARITALKKAGYTVDLVNMHVNEDEAYRRMIARFLRTGRIIDANYFNFVDSKPSRTYLKIRGEGQINEALNIDGNGPVGTLTATDGENTKLAKDLRLGRLGGQIPSGSAPGRAATSPEQVTLAGPLVPGIPPHRVTAANGMSVDVSPVVVEANSLRTSQDPGYDPSLQPRQRDRAASQAQVRDIATNLDPARLGYSAEADRGAPIVGPDGMVESGNGRVLALRSVYDQGGAAAQAYRSWLASQGVDVSAYRNPVLVRQRTTPFAPDQRQAFTVAANQAATLSMSAPERALADARMLDANAISLIHNPDDLGSAGNRAFVRRFVAQLPQGEQGMMADAKGALSADGLARVRNAVLAKAYGDAGLLSRIAESTNDEVRSISSALTAAAPQWARLRAEIEAGRVRPGVDATADLLEAVKRTADLRASGEKLDTYLAQQDAFHEPGRVEDFMQAFYDPRGRRAASAQRITDALRFYAQEAGKVNAEEGLGLGLVPVRPEDILRLTLERQREGYGAEEGLPNRFGAGYGAGDEAGRGEVRGSWLGEARARSPEEGDAGDQESAIRAQRLSLDDQRRLAGERVQLAGGKTGEQFVFPGTERITSAELAKRRAAEPLRPKAAQQSIDEGLFGGQQFDLVDQARQAAGEPAIDNGSKEPQIAGIEAPNAVRSGTEGTGIRAGAPAVSQGEQAGRTRRATPVGRPEQLSLFGGGPGERPVPDANDAVQQQSGGAEVAAPGPGTSVTKPPARSGRTGEARPNTPAVEGLNEATAKIAQRTRSNYRITDADQIGVGGPRQKINDNINAIRTLKLIEDEGRDATPGEKAILVKYVGWGAFAQDMFSPHKPEWKTERDTMRSLVSDEEYTAAKGSTLNAHYTSPDVVRGMWDAMNHLGFKGGMAIEPAAGVGHFLGMIPDKVAKKTAWTAVELDPLTGRMAKALYGNAEVNVHGFEDLKRPSNYYDLAISNVPFGKYNISEKPYGSFPIHDFFFVKSLDKVRPGGVVAFITSRYSMDRFDPGTRRLLAKSADLVGAIRLPGGNKGAFAGNAGTQVTTDIMFLRKKIPGEAPFLGAPWMESKEIQTPDGPARINEYFADHPEMMLGEMRLQGTMYRDNEPVLIGDSTGLQDKILAAAQNMPKDAMTPRATPKPAPIHGNDIAAGIKDGAFFLKDGKLFQRREGQGFAHPLNAQDHDRVVRLIGMRSLYDDLLNAQMHPEQAVNQPDILRANLRDAYDSFVAKYGPINKEERTVTSRLNKLGEPVVITRQPNIADFRADPDVWKVASIEDYNSETDKAKRADIQTKDIINAPRERQINGPSDALAASLNDTGGVDLDHIAQSLNLRTQEDVVRSLGDTVYQNPNGRKFETADSYLSGDVVKKLEDARAISAEDTSYMRNVSALEKVQPEPLTAGDITAQFGAPWVPADVYKHFLEEIGGSGIEVSQVPITGEWKTKANFFSRDARSKYGTERVEVKKVVDAALNNRQITVYDEDHDGNKSVNEKDTTEARVKTELLKEAFTGDPDHGIDGWAFADPERSQRLESIYNRTYNNLVARKFDGSHLTLPGLNPDFATRQHRKDAVWRIIQNGNTLLAHAVGSGKTATMIAAGMEQKRLGLISKPAYVVPNHMLEQFSREFIQAYPDAKILVAQKDEMTRENRKAFLAKTASNDWDGVIMTHDAFGRINMGQEFRKSFITDQLDQLERVIRAEVAESGSKKSPTVKNLENMKKKLQERLLKLMNEERKDDGTSFEESGIDHLFVDEAHKFKNLAFITRMQRVKGLAQGNSQRAEDLFLKMRYLEQKNPERSGVFATGTPVSNTMAELWTMMRYLELDKLKERGLDNFDNWANTFGRTVNNMELSADGRTFKEVTSFSKFTNVPELISLYSEIADTKTASMLNLPSPKVKTRSGAPGIEIVEATPSSQEEAHIESLVKLAEEIKGKRPEKGQPNMLSIVTAGRKVATDGRLIGSDFDYNPQGKIAKAIDNISRIYKEGNADPEAPNKVQMVFLDMGVPQSKGAAKVRKAADIDEDVGADPAQAEVPRIDLYADIKKRLVDSGIPAKEIAAIHDATDDAKKAKLFQKVRTGEVRVILGSSEKMGVGTNVQDRLVAMHHLDAPWKPADVEQRDGRIVRQGNKNPEVQIYRYVTKKSFDAFMWQKLDTKSKFIGQVLSGAKGSRHAEDIDNPLPEAAEMKAAASGDPRIIEHAELDRQVRALTAQRRSFEATKSRAQWESGTAKTRIGQYEEALPNAKADAAMVQDVSGQNFNVELGGNVFTERKEAGQAILNQLLAIDAQRFYAPKLINIGKLSGFEMNVEVRNGWDGSTQILSATPSLKGKAAYATPNDTVINAQTDPGGLIRRFENILGNIKSNPDRLEGQLASEKDSVKNLEKTLAQNWPKEKDYRDAITKLDDLTKSLKAPKNPDAGSPEALLAAANDLTKEWQQRVGDDIKVVLGGSLVSKTYVQHGKELPDLDVRFLTKDPERDWPRVAEATGLKFRKARMFDDYPNGQSKGVLVEGPVTRNGITFDVEAAVRSPDYVGWARFYPEVMTPREIEAYRKEKADLKSSGDKDAYKALKLRVLDEVKKRVNDWGLLSGDAEVKAQRAEPPFYSAVDRTIQNAKQEKATPDQWLGMLRNAPGVKPEEMQWLGIEEWLKEQKGPVTKEQVQDYIRANSIEVQEVHKGGGRPALDAIDKQIREISNWPHDPHAARDPANQARLDELLDQWREADSQPESGPTKFSSYIKNKGENYRELLLTLPYERQIKWEKTPEGHLTGGGYTIKHEPFQDRPAYITYYNNDGTRVSSNNSLKGAQNLIERSSRGVDASKAYKSSHWPEHPNTLANVLFSDRVIDGKKYLQIHEEQSDWHQKGRAEGYRSDLEKINASGNEALNKYNAAKLNLDHLTDTGLATAEQLDKAMADVSRFKVEADRLKREYLAKQNAVPDAPFKTTWHELATKRMVRYAAEHGYDGVIVDNGETVASRYDLSQHVKEIEYVKNADGTYKLGIADIEGEPIRSMPGIDVNRMTMEDIGATVGKKIAEKIANGEGKKYRGHDGNTLEGLDLKVGGEFHRKLYDEKIPQALNKIGKKFGAKTDRINLESENYDAKKFSVTQEDGEWGVTSLDERRTRYFDTREEAVDYATEHSENLSSNTAHTLLPITESLREAATQQGFPLFRRGWDAAEGRDFGPKPGEKVVPIGRKTEAHIKPTDKYTAAEQKIADAVQEIGDRMAPQATMAGTSALRQHGSPIWGAFVNSKAFPHLIAWSLEQRDAGKIAGTVRHEIIHHLREAGLIRPDEWAALRDAAVKDGWLSKHRINDRYPDLSLDHRIEEAVAEQFAKWRTERSIEKPGLIRDAFQRMDLMFRRIAAAARQFLGKDATANDVFTRIETGEVGRRRSDQIEAQKDYQGREAAQTPGEENRRQRALARNLATTEPTLRDRLVETSDALRQKAADFSKKIGVDELVRNLQMKTSPMAVRDATVESRAIAKEFMNARRQSRQAWNQADKYITDNFTPEQRKRMWEAADEQSVAMQRGMSTEGIGLDRLPAAERSVVEMLQGRGVRNLKAMSDLRMIDTEGLPSYAPRMIVRMAEGKYEHGAGPGAEIVRDVRTLALANAKLEDAIAARELINSIEEVGRKSGNQTVNEGGEPAYRPGPEGQISNILDQIGRSVSTTTPQLKHRKYLTAAETEAAANRVPARPSDENAPKWFTLNHPAFQKLEPRMVDEDPKIYRDNVRRVSGMTVENRRVPLRDEDGNIVYDRKPIYVRGDFEGPLRAVLSKDTDKFYNALMALKGKAMSVIMMSPLIHNQVEWGRALPVAPGKVLTFQTYLEGNKVANDPKQMARAIAGGVVPIGGHGFMQDLVSIAEAPTVRPGRSLTAKGLGYGAEALGHLTQIYNPRAGADKVRSGVDWFGNLWHNTLLWDRVRDLQMGLWSHLEQRLIEKGYDPYTANVAAAHFANRYAGALPIEAMSGIARGFANVLLFSRSFTLGNLGAYKDAMIGLPRDAQAMIQKNVGYDQLQKIQSFVKRKSMAMLAIDAGLFYATLSALQSSFNVAGVGHTVATLGGMIAGGALGGKGGTYGRLAAAAGLGAAGFGLASVLGASQGVRTLEDELGQYWDRFGDMLHRLYEHPGEVLGNPFKTIESIGATAENEPGKKSRLLIGYQPDGTAIYARLAVGKVTEELMGYMTEPNEMIHRKLSTFARPFNEIWTNDVGFGHKLYNPKADTPAEVGKNILKIGAAIVGSQIPLDTIKGALDWYKGGPGSDVSGMKAIAPFIGTTISKGYPGGPELGVLADAKARQQYRVQEAMPGIRDQIRQGDIAGALTKMQELNIPRGLQTYYVKTTQTPSARLNARQLRDFMQAASPEEKREFERAQRNRPETSGSGGQAAGGAVIARAAGGLVRRADGGGIGYVPPQENYNAANSALKLTPQEQVLYQRHLQNLYGEGGVDNPDGSRSSLYQAVQEHNGKFYNIPTVWDGKRETQPWTNPDTGKTMDVPNDTALSNVNKAGWDSFPSYDTSGVADDRYDQMHGYMEKDTDSYLTPGRARGGRVEPKNINHNPSPAQASSGNYKKDHVNVLGLNITIENAKGKPRHGVGRDGKPWSAILGAHYGYFKRSEARDGDNVDCYLGPHIKSPHVFVIDQIDHETGKYDEAKCCVGFANEKQALRAYEAGFSDGKGKDRIGKVTAMTIQQFKDWLKHGNTKAPFNHAKREIA